MMFNGKDLTAFLPFLAALIFGITSLCSGCAYKGAKVVEGTDLCVGMEVPGSDGVAQLNVLNYLSGFRLGVAKNANLEVNYTVAETNQYFGIVRINTAKTINAKVQPCEDAQTK